jgi:basic membrane protein A
MLKRVDRAVFETCQDVKNNKFTSGTKNLNLADQGIDYALDENNASLISPEMKKKVDAVKAGIIAGKIKVPDFYTKK